MTQLERLKIFIKEGFHHILSGYDHLLFIFMLLIPSIALFSTKNKQIDIYVLLKLITTFTLAHSLTLFLAGYDIFSPNTRVIESCIALSIAIVAVLNLFAQYKYISYRITFVFGLLHGFGFANVLVIAGMDNTKAFIVALLGFNLGVEIGQIMVILIILSIAFFLFRNRYSLYLIKTMSAVSLFISCYWFVQRIGLI